jgi:hypothetical protein
MKIELHNVTIRELVENYKSSIVEGVSAYGGKLDVRPKYQREFVYKDKQRDAVIQTVRKNFPLNTMYWVVNTDENGEKVYEVLDGQQRTISIAEFHDGNFSPQHAGGDPDIEHRYFHNLTDEEKEQFLNYELQVYFCEGSEKQKLDWFRIINIAGEKLSDQELRNAVYTGPWLTDAKAYLSKKNGAGENLGKQYLSGDFVRQAYLETALKWINSGDIEGYMSAHQHDKNAEPLWNHFKEIIAWVKKTFPEYRQEMKGLDWGSLYANYGKTKLDPEKLEEQIAILMADEDVTSKKGIYQYVLDGQEISLNIRSFNLIIKREAYERQKGQCVKCEKKFAIGDMEADHATPWSKGGKTNAINCQMLCKEDNRRKSNK